VETSDQLALAGRPRLELSDIFRQFRPWLKPISKTESKVVSDIVNCRTSVLGGHRLECNACNYSEYSYNSCRNRHCPKCQFLAQAKWVDARKAELLPVQYFHMVFTVPHELNGIIWANKKIFQAMSKTLKEVAENRLQAKIGFTAVLHTWSQTLGRHAHIHAIVPGGGLSLDGKNWISADQGYFLPIKILSAVFRAKFLELLEEAFAKLKFSDSIADFSNQNKFKNLLLQAARHEWVVYAKAPFAGPGKVLEYLGNYTHRIAISNYRIEEVTETHVTFKYKDRSDGNKTKSLTLPAQEFIDRFLAHALPGKFVRLRHFGFLGSKGKEKNLATARIFLNARKIEKAKDENWRELLKRLTGADISLCPCCKKGSLIETAKLLPHGNLSTRKLDTS
jgi:hypothetical protein